MDKQNQTHFTSEKVNFCPPSVRESGVKQVPTPNRMVDFRFFILPVPRNTAPKFVVYKCPT